jgi:hypothetical protein
MAEPPDPAPGPAPSGGEGPAAGDAPAPAPAGDDDVPDLRGLTPLGWLRARLEEPPSYWLTRFWLLRLLGVVYFFAFLALVNQVVPLVGADGLLPIQPLLDAGAEEYGSAWRAFWREPTVFWMGAPDGALVGLAWVGLGLSLVVAAGYANGILLGVLWALYFSFLKIGQDWYSYGWDMQLAETGFLAMFLVPLLDGRPFPRRRTPVVVIFLFRWLVVRVMLGAGLIKWRHDPCWQELTCLATHFETQPLPNALSRAFHLLPGGVKAFGVIVNHAAELIAPLLAFGPRRLRHIAGLVMIGFQLTLIASGNLSLLNWLTIVAIAACLDDGLLARVTPRRLRERAEAARAAARPSPAEGWCVGILFAVYLVLSIDPVVNLASSEQKMNYSFNRLLLASAYGAFGSMDRERNEIVFEGTLDAEDPPGGEAVWREYEFPCKPGDPMRRPCVAAPYQYRLDWQMWFAWRGGPGRYPAWSLHLVWKLLHGDRTVLRLLDGDPFPDRPPRRVRALLYRYRFADPDDPDGAWWRRERLTMWLPPVSADDPQLVEFLRRRGLGPPEPGQ